MGPGIPDALHSTPHAYLSPLVLSPHDPHTHCHWVSPDGDPWQSSASGTVESTLKQCITC